MNKRILMQQQLERKIQPFVNAKEVTVPQGWIKSIRTALGITMHQLANKLGITKQAVLDMEKREVEGAITLKTLRDVAAALDMQLVYGFVPNALTLDAFIEKKATELAKQIVMRTAQSMKLEDQSNTDERILSAIKERAVLIKNEMPKMLWD